MANIEGISKNFDHREAEGRLYRNWEEKDYFHTPIDPAKEPYTISMPPPNITGQLHMGHALNNTLQDILIRWRRMQGYAALWVPGTDHASIATEAKIVEALRAEGLDKDDLGREKFLERAWAWKEQYGSRIVDQLKRIGCSCDWKRERFTMDEGLSRAVTEVFVKLYDKGLIYRGERMINWCPHCLTSISDAEVEYEEQASNLWHIRYPYEDGSGYIVVATTRPETMFGDTAVAVHPDDERYRSYIGKNVILPLVEKPIPVIADEYVDPEFGTGVVKITPAHDPNDYEVGLRHDLPIITCITEDGHMNSYAGPYAGLTAMECRRQAVADLEKTGALVKTEPYTHNVGTCYRCNTTVDPRLSLQWFVKMEPLAKPAVEAVREGKTAFVPDRFSKIYYNWMENIRDWCISRQLWWGHRIPAYYCEDCDHITVAATRPTACPACGCRHLKQDEDSLDTWFSSALWPFSTLGWPEETEDLAYFYPNRTLVTGADIIFFWVARMIFSALEQTGEVPFDHVFIHGIVRDDQGRKMSKSLGNGIDPLEVIDEYGADALRYALVTGNAPGNDQRYQPAKLSNGSAFVNKVWNAFRFVMMNLSEQESFAAAPKTPTTLENKWILSAYNRLVREVTRNLEQFELGVGLGKIVDFFWDDFCDWYIEMIKPRLNGDDAAVALEAQVTARYILIGALKLLHPFMPFFTTEIYRLLPGVKEADDLMLAVWPEVESELLDEDSENRMAIIMEATRSIRSIRLEKQVPAKKTAPLIVSSDDEAVLAMFGDAFDYLKRLANVAEIRLQKTTDPVPDNAVTAVVHGCTLYIPLDDLIDYAAEEARLQKELVRLTGEVKRLSGKLANEGFVNGAPAVVVQKEKDKLTAAQEMLAEVTEQLEKIKKR